MEYKRHEIVFARNDIKRRIEDSLLSAHKDWTNLIMFTEPLECYRITKVSYKNRLYHITHHYNPFYQHPKMVQGFEWNKLVESDCISLDDYLDYVKTFTLIKGENNDKKNKLIKESEVE